jgi:hypothetical protein
MTLSKQEYIEAFKQFSDIYRSKVELTGETLRKVDPFKLPMHPDQPITYTEVNEIAIKMPQDEYERFLQNWKQYIDLMYVTSHNPIIREEFEKVLIMVNLMK